MRGRRRKSSMRSRACALLDERHEPKCGLRRCVEILARPASAVPGQPILPDGRAAQFLRRDAKRPYPRPWRGVAAVRTRLRRCAGRSTCSFARGIPQTVPAAGAYRTWSAVAALACEFDPGRLSNKALMRPSMRLPGHGRQHPIMRSKNSGLAWQQGQLARQDHASSMTLCNQFAPLGLRCGRRVPRQLSAVWKSRCRGHNGTQSLVEIFIDRMARAGPSKEGATNHS